VAMRGRDHWRGYHDADSTRLNLWSGQDRDGRKWNKNMDGGKALPWDGASDMRIWLVDLLVKAKVAFAMEIIARSQVAVQPLTGQDVRRAGLSPSTVTARPLTDGRYAVAGYWSLALKAAWESGNVQAEELSEADLQALTPEPDL